MLFSYSKAKGERFGIVDSEDGEYQDYSPESASDFLELADRVGGVVANVLATSPDWEAEPDTDGLGFFCHSEAFVDGMVYYEGVWSSAHTIWDTGAVLLTGTPESFEVDEEPWVDDGSADDDGLMAYWTYDVDERQPCPGAGWDVNDSNAARFFSDIGDTLLTWLPEDFEPAPDAPEPVPPPTDLELMDIANLIAIYNLLSEAGKAYIWSRLGA